ncbi:MAG: hypothetical protein O4749_01145, partial [Trichodesmium sp. St5_bin2_1]|nr:hypothetical protein [Trichodesmium sp. St5_bin2_1]
KIILYTNNCIHLLKEVRKMFLRIIGLEHNYYLFLKSIICFLLSRKSSKTFEIFYYSSLRVDKVQSFIALINREERLILDFTSHTAPSFIGARSGKK